MLNKYWFVFLSFFIWVSQRWFVWKKVEKQRSTLWMNTSLVLHFCRCVFVMILHPDMLPHLHIAKTLSFSTAHIYTCTETHMRQSWNRKHTHAYTHTFFFNCCIKKLSKLCSNPGSALGHWYWYSRVSLVECGFTLGLLHIQDETSFPPLPFTAVFSECTQIIPPICKTHYWRV